MRRTLHWGGLALTIVVAALPSRPARADAESCAEFRQSIVGMEAESVRPPGWFAFDLTLRALYTSSCIDHPTRQRPIEYWYRADGTSTGVRTDAPGERPKDAAYATTQKIGDACRKDPRDPSSCALLRGLAETCASPAGEVQRDMCVLLLANDPADLATPPKGEALPPLLVALDGGPFTLDPACTSALAESSASLASGTATPADRKRWLATMQSHCPDFLAALERRAGASAQRGAERFWPALGELAQSGFAPPGPATVATATAAADPGFQRMCKEAREFRDTCATRQRNMGPVGGSGRLGTTGQAGAFNECKVLYANVAAMCAKTDAAAQAHLSSQSAAPASSVQCQALLQGYVAAAQANDGPKSVAGYNALKQAGGCGVLDQAERQAVAAVPHAADPRFPSRGGTPFLDQTARACDRQAEQCAAVVNQLKAGTSPEASAAMYANAIGIGLQLGASMSQAFVPAVPSVAAPGTDMSSIGNARVRSTYGQGAPTRTAPRSSPSTITGLGR